ncbi:MAG TPA: hypothetical protein VF715_14035 [Thermoleophilaceae bacterium]
MGYRTLLCAVLLLLLAAAPARAHDGEVTHGDSIQELNFDFAAAIEANDQITAPSAYGDSGLSYLPKRWCGTERSTDDTANQVHDPSLPQVKFVYAYASDQVNRTTQWADLLQANASLISRFYAQQSDSQRAPRFDLGTSCGADYVDVVTVALPNPRSTYVDGFTTLKNAVYAALPATSGEPRNYVILADKLSSRSAGSLLGQGEVAASADTKGTGNQHNRGGYTSIIWIPQLQSLPSTESSKDQGFWPEGFLHEMTHTFGGVMNGSPNSTTAGHCRDGRDVMCYSDGGLAYDPSVCPAVSTFTTQFVQLLDCGRDDYFSPAPTEASWLATHHNTFDSVFNGDCPALGNQCGGGGGAPAVTDGPAVTGTTRQGHTLTANLGTWSGEPSLDWEWEEEVSGSWQAYAHESTALTLGSANVGRRYRVKVTAAGSETVVARSNPTAAVTTRLTPSVTARPAVSGTARNGETLTGTTGSWSNAQSYAYQWLRYDGTYEEIPGATSPSYTVTLDDLDYYIRLRVTATSEDGLSASTTSSNMLGPVVSAPVNTTPPSVSGTAKVSRTLSSGLGSWSQSVTSYARAWQREVGGEWTSITGATSSSYTATEADTGRRLRLAVTATNANGSTTAYSSPTTAVAALSPPVNTAAPVVTGTAQQGQTLTAGSDTWSGASSTSVVWQRRASGGDWAAISGATARTYVPAAADVDAELRAVVTATNGDGSATAASAARGPVVTNVAPGNTAPPAIGGTARRGETLSATSGTWLRADSYAYAWQRLEGGTWTPIAGAGAATYVPVSADGGRPLRVVVTATGPGGSTQAASAQTAAVADPPVAVAPPTVAGEAKRGRTLTASPGTWTNATAYAYSWERETAGGWNAIAGATSATYLPGADDVGRALRVRVTASNATAAADPSASAATGPVADAIVPANTAPPVVEGVLTEGETLTAAGDAWTGHTALAVQWQRRSGAGAWSPIAGATARTYALTAADVGADVRVLVTATGADGETAAASAARGPVAAPTPAPAPTPSPDPTPAPPDPVAPVTPGPVTPGPASPGPITPVDPAPVVPPAEGPLSVRAKVSLKAGRKPVGTLVFAITRTGTVATAKITGTRLKAADGSYTARFCAGRKCTTRTAAIKRGKVTVAKQALPAARGTIAVTLKPRRGASLSGRLVL